MEHHTPHISITALPGQAFVQTFQGMKRLRGNVPFLKGPIDVSGP